MITKDKGLPVIISMSDLAASGGYYMAAAGDVLVAQPGTLTGSIGVYTGKFVTAGTLEKVGANIEGVSNTDGLCSTQRPIPGYPMGFFSAIHDDQALAIVKWETVLAALKLPTK